MLSRLGLTFVKSFFPWANSIYVSGPVSAFLAIAKDPSVSYLEQNSPMHYLADTDVWASAILLTPIGAACVLWALWRGAAAAWHRR